MKKTNTPFINPPCARLIQSNLSSVEPGDIIMLSQPQVMDSVERKFSYEILLSRDPVKVLHIKPGFKPR